MTMLASDRAAASPDGTTTRVRRLIGRLDHRLVAPGPRGRFEVIRAALALVLAARLGLRHWSEAAAIPPRLFRPAFVVGWLDAPPPGWLLTSVAIIGVLAAVATIVGLRPRIGFVVAWLALLFLAGVWGSAGKVMHNDVLLLLATVPFVAARGRPRAGDADPDRAVAFGWPPRAALIIIATVYFLAGAQKLNHSGLAWITSDNMRWVLLQGARADRSPFPGLARAMASSSILASLIAAGSIILELAAPVLLALRRTRMAFALGALCLHGTIWLTLGLDYYGWILTVAAVAIPMGWPLRRAADDDPATGVEAGPAAGVRVTGGPRPTN